MALHGTIEVSGHPIGNWSAVRKGPRSATGVNDYRCEVTLHGWHRRVDVTHRYDDGALRLAALIFTALWAKMPTSPATAILKDA